MISQKCLRKIAAFGMAKVEKSVFERVFNDEKKSAPFLGVEWLLIRVSRFTCEGQSIG